MKPIIVFFKSSLVTGLLILLPVGLIYLTLQEFFGLALLLMKPVAEALFPADFGGFESPVLLAIGLLVAASLFLGILARSEFVPDYEVCIDGLCQRMTHWVPISKGATTVRSCAAR